MSSSLSSLDNTYTNTALTRPTVSFGREQQRQQMGGIGGAERKQKEVSRRLAQMENRLDNALIKYNRRVAENRDLRGEIDSCRRQRLVYDNIYTGLELELATKKKNMAKLISKTSTAMQKQDRLRLHLNKLQLQIEKEQNDFNKKWHTLGTEITMGREAHTAKLKKEMEEKGLLTDQKMGDNEDGNESNEKNNSNSTQGTQGMNGTNGTNESTRLNSVHTVRDILSKSLRSIVKSAALSGASVLYIPYDLYSPLEAGFGTRDFVTLVRDTRATIMELIASQRKHTSKHQLKCVRFVKTNSKSNLLTSSLISVLQEQFASDIFHET